MLVALAVLPDLDVFGFYAGIPYAHPLGHRGLSHSLPFALVAGLAAATLCFREVEFGTKRWVALSLLASLACASHGLLDAITDAGLGVGFFIPLDDGRYFFGWRPLRTSPLSVGAFFSEQGLAILANEASYVGIPAAIAGGVGLAFRRLRRRAAGD